MTADRSGCTARRHGTESAYHYGCRCPDAREDKRIREKRRRYGRPTGLSVPVVRPQRQLRALAALGWSMDALAACSSLSVDQIVHVRAGRRDWVQRATADAVDDLYERLSGTPGPSRITRERARRAGWVPPLLWEGVDIDDPAATPAVDEGPAVVPRPELDLLTRAQRLRAELQAAAPYSGQPWSWPAVAARLGVKPKTLEKARQRARKEAA